LREQIEPEEKPVEVPVAVEKGVHYTRQATGCVVKVSDFLMTSLAKLTVKAGTGVKNIVQESEVCGWCGFFCMMGVVFVGWRLIDFKTELWKYFVVDHLYDLLIFGGGWGGGGKGRREIYLFMTEALVCFWDTFCLFLLFLFFLGHDLL